MALAPRVPTTEIVGCLQALDRHKQGTILRDDLESLLCVYLGFSKSDVSELLDLSPAVQNNATVRYVELIDWLFDIPGLSAPDQVQCELVVIDKPPISPTGPQKSVWSATEAYYEYATSVMCKQWKVVDSHWMIFMKTSGFVPSGHGKGPLFIAGRIKDHNLVAQVQRMYGEGVRIAGFGVDPVWQQVQPESSHLFFPDKDVVMPRKGTFWESTFHNNDDSEGEFVVVQIGYHQKTSEQIQAAPDDHKFMFVGNGFYWQVKLGDFIGNNLVDDHTVWFSCIPT